jgi:hypothetical protein
MHRVSQLQRPERARATPPAREAVRPERAPPAPLASQVRFNFADIDIQAPAIQAFSGVHPSNDRFENEAHAVADELEDSGGGGGIRPVGRMPQGAGGLRGVHPCIRSSIDEARGGGSRLPDPIASSVGGHLDADLSGVRVHTDERADTLNRQLNARAFTTGRDIFFRSGEYNPSSAFGRTVLNHELTHVVQQCGPQTTQGPPSAAPIQRFILQLGEDDGYTRTMRRSLMSEHKGEQHAIGNSIWNQNEKPYAPTRLTSFRKKTVADTKLAKLPSNEPVRIVGHGSYAGLVAGYSAQQLLELLQRLGLPQNHRGGINIHACLPASALGDNGKKRQPTITVLQDLLRAEGYAEEVRGYEHCIFPQESGAHYEIESAGYNLYTKVVQKLDAAFRENTDYTLSADQIQYIKNGLGDEGEALLKKYADDKGYVKDVYHLFCDLSWEFEKSSHYHKQARLRRGSSVRLQDA